MITFEVERMDGPVPFQSDWLTTDDKLWPKEEPPGDGLYAMNVRCGSSAVPSIPLVWSPPTSLPRCRVCGGEAIAVSLNSEWLKCHGMCGTQTFSRDAWIKLMSADNPTGDGCMTLDELAEVGLWVYGISDNRQFIFWDGHITQPFTTLHAAKLAATEISRGRKA